MAVDPRTRGRLVKPWSATAGPPPPKLRIDVETGDPYMVDEHGHRPLPPMEEIEHTEKAVSWLQRLRDLQKGGHDFDTALRIANEEFPDGG